jgi:uncharacterized protein (DUF2141 family)
MVKAVFPAPGSVNVALKTKISFEFNEWIASQNPEKAVSLFPRPAQGYSVRVSGRTITIIPHQPLQDSTTYHVLITTELKDVHQVPLSTPLHHIFSTGPHLDSASLSGCVIAETVQLQHHPKVALFSLDNNQSPSDTLYFSLPSYLIQTDSLGGFSLTNLRAGRYSAIAFIDKNNDERFQPLTEQLFLPPSQISIITKKDSLFFFAATADTTTRTLISVRPQSAQLISAQWNRSGLTARDSAQPPTLRIISLDSTVVPPVISGYVPHVNGTSFTLQLATALKLAPYALIYAVSPLVGTRPDSTLLDTIRFNGVIAPDTTRPRLLRTTPLKDAPLRVPLTLTWSEPVRVSATTLSATDSLGDSVKVTVSQGVADTTLLTPVRRLKAGTTYRIAIATNLVRDLSANTARDSADTASVVTITLTTLASDNVALRISGSSPCLPPDPRRIWEYQPLGSPHDYRSAERGGRFVIDSIPAGKGMVGFFEDHNGDERYQGGRLLPWRAPEPRFMSSDTIEARARWEIDAIAVKICKSCAISTLEQPGK